MAKDESSSNKRARDVDDAEVVVVGDENPPSTLPEIQERIKQLIKRIPSKEETAALTLDDIPAMERWCKTVRKITRDYNLSLNFVAIANYQWEPDRPGKLSPENLRMHFYLFDAYPLTRFHNIFPTTQVTLVRVWVH
jgi:hypothetical protein